MADLNSMEQYFAVWGSAVEGMNLLQEEGGIISDEAVHPADVAESDAFKAMKWLSDRHSEWIRRS